MKNVSRKYGFTLLELLVVVIIIAVLAAVAWPQYKHAVLKSRLSTVMPMAKAVADAQEVYYLGRGYYARNDEKDLLDITPVKAENTTVLLSPTDGYDYVMARRSDVAGVNYIMYQKYSENYPGEIHCEADSKNADALWLCGNLSQNNSVGETLTQGYITYLISGTGMGISPWADLPTCTQALSMGYTCSLTTNEETGETIKKVCTNSSGRNVCRIKTYDEEGGYTSVKCRANDQNVCIDSIFSSVYDADGNMLRYRYCSNNSIDSQGNCQAAYGSGYIYTYDTDGNRLTVRRCTLMDTAGKCHSWLAEASYDYTYDDNGNRQTVRQCSKLDAEGNCTVYSGANSYRFDYTLDPNGNILTQRLCPLDSDGNCTAYSTGYNYTYDDAGNMLSNQICNKVDNSGVCTAYGQKYNYTYDDAGNRLSETKCSVSTTTGDCLSYGQRIDYTYDDNGKLLTQHYCKYANSSGNCSSYNGGTVYKYEEGGLTKFLSCSGFDTNNNCTAYSSGTYTVYDDKGTAIVNYYCPTYAIDAQSGECTGGLFGSSWTGEY